MLDNYPLHDKIVQLQATITELESDYRILNHMYAAQQATIAEQERQLKWWIAQFWLEKDAYLAALKEDSCESD